MKIKGELYIVLVCMTAGLGGFLFGFDTAVISGAINFLRIRFHLSSLMEGWLMSSALAGCVVGAAIAGYLADRYGRKPILLLSALLFILSAAGCAVAETPSFLVVARIVGGIGVGFAAMVAPLFISELAPARLRGRLVSLYQLAITLGILCSYLSNTWLLSYSHSHRATGGGGIWHAWLVAEVWRGMLGSDMAPALLFFLFLLFVPESPRWLLSRGIRVKAEKILLRLNGPEGALAELTAIDGSSLGAEKGSLKDLTRPGMRVALIIGLVLPFLSQLSGITTVMYYAPAIFEKAGFASGSAFGSAVVIGFCNMMFTFIAIWKVDKWGRKPLLTGGFVTLAIALFLIGWAFKHSENTYLLLPAFVFYIAIFAATLGPGVWVVLAEIYPTKIRGRAMSLGTLSLFIGSTVVTQTYPLLRESIGIGNVFLLYGLIMLPGAAFVKRLVPETKGKSLEEIERYWEEKDTTVVIR